MRALPAKQQPQAPSRRLCTYIIPTPTQNTPVRLSSIVPHVHVCFVFCTEVLHASTRRVWCCACAVCPQNSTQLRFPPHPPALWPLALSPPHDVILLAAATNHSTAQQSTATVPPVALPREHYAVPTPWPPPDTQAMVRARRRRRAVVQHSMAPPQ